MAARISKDNFTQAVLEESLPVLVEFYSDSCIPCKQMSPILGAVEDDYEDQLKVYKVNVNFDAELAADYEVMASPTLLFFKGGKEVERLRGLVKKPELLEHVKKLLED
jgi:thioredoxin 1